MHQEGDNDGGGGDDAHAAVAPNQQQQHQRAGSSGGSGGGGGGAGGAVAGGVKCAIWHCVRDRDRDIDVCVQCARIRNAGWRALARAAALYAEGVSVWEQIDASPGLSEALFAVDFAYHDSNPFKRHMGRCARCSMFHPYLQTVAPPPRAPGAPPAIQAQAQRLCEACVQHYRVQPVDARGRPTSVAFASF